MTPGLQRDLFRAMGTTCMVAVTAEPRDAVRARRALEVARREVAACERALSRFDARSDLSLLNGASGSWVKIDIRLIEALAAALRARVDTDGRFDPTILPALLAAGYDSSFELLTERPPTALDGWRAGAQVDIDQSSLAARVARGAAIDLGGIGKGFAASRALEAMQQAWPGIPGALLDLGGDISVWGRPPEGGPWRVDIEDPRASDRIVGTLELRSGGVASSGRNRRRFGPECRQHHLIDPTTGAPAVVGPLAVTVVATSATEAEVHATALAVTDVDDAHGYLSARPDVAALLIPRFGDSIPIGSPPLVRERPCTRLVVTMQRGRV
jgi:thiamine biosynthesis lipoprotein